MTTLQLIDQIKTKSFLCIGLDVDLNKIPPHLLQLEDHFEFNETIIDTFIILPFYEAYGIKGWMSLQKRFSTSTKIPRNLHDCGC
jgi:orotidine-5'-phosphate decarboxylase